jgi:apolipoprotein N-acyltransferase
MIQDAAGVWNAFLGKESGAKSGIAIDSLVEQGTTTLAEINDNYRVARQLVGELLLAHIVDDIGDKRREVKVGVNRPNATKVIVLNDRRVDGGKTQITNSVMVAANGAVKYGKTVLAPTK